MLNVNNICNLSTLNVYRAKQANKTNKVCSYNAINFRASNNLLFQSDKEFLHKLKMALLHFVGQGSEGKVYKIPETEFCIKIPHFSSNYSFGKWFFKTNNEDKINHVVAKSESGAQIMKFIEGQPLNYKNKPKEIYNLPLKSYKSFIKQIEEAGDNMLRFDNAPANIIYNAENKTITAIDFKVPNIDIDFVPTPFASAYRGLQALKEQPDHQKLNKNLLGKLLKIALDELNSKKPEVSVTEHDIMDLMTWFEYSQNNLPKQYEFLKQAMKEIFTLKKYEARGQDVSQAIQGKTKYANCIIKQILL